MLTALYAAVTAGDLKLAQRLQNKIYLLKAVVYDHDEPSGDAHARMKTAMVLAGRLKSDRTRPPIETPDAATRERIRNAVRAANLAPAQAADAA